MNPRILLSIKDDRIAFRFQGVLPCRFQSYLFLYRCEMPNMRWSKSAHMWIIPLQSLTIFYEISRAAFGARNIYILEPNSNTNTQPVQYSLFPPEELR